VFRRIEGISIVKGVCCIFNFLSVGDGEGKVRCRKQAIALIEGFECNGDLTSIILLRSCQFPSLH